MPTKVMGVVNVTPDSFSDGGRHFDGTAAIGHALALVADGAGILDIGGESTRPGAEPVSEEEERARVVPVIQGVRLKTDVTISVDTMKPAVARAAVAAGATMWNDVAALRSAGALDTAAELSCDIVLMHMLGEPRTMQIAPRYDDVVGEVEAFLLERAQVAIAAGVAKGRIWFDPGIGFGKTVDHNLSLIAALPRLVDHGYPIVLGASRKRFIASLHTSAKDAGSRLGGSIAAALAGAAAGVAAVRVHDVRETAQALAVWSHIEEAH